MYAANAKAMPLLAKPYESGAPEVESLLRLREAGLDVVEVPVHMRERASGESNCAAAERSSSSSRWSGRSSSTACGAGIGDADDELEPCGPAPRGRPRLFGPPRRAARDLRRARAARRDGGGTRRRRPAVGLVAVPRRRGQRGGPHGQAWQGTCSRVLLDRDARTTLANAVGAARVARSTVPRSRARDFGLARTARESPARRSASRSRRSISCSCRRRARQPASPAPRGRVLVDRAHPGRVRPARAGARCEPSDGARVEAV